jgi:hypothetical protein
MNDPQGTDLEVCEFCGRGFATLNGLKIHCAKAHRLEMELETAGWVVMEKYRWEMTEDL